MSVNVTNLGLIKIKSLASDPANTDAGLMYYNSVSGKFKFYNGAVWADVGGSSIASTDALTEGTTNLYFTVARAKAAAVADAINNGTTDVAPSQNAVFDALALKADLTGATFSGAISATNLSGTNTGDQDLAPYALLASPALTGTPTAPTATGGTNTTQIATTAFVTSAVAAAGSGANTALSNLASTAVNVSIIPAVHNTVDIGQGTLSFRNFYGESFGSSGGHASRIEFGATKGIWDINGTLVFDWTTTDILNIKRGASNTARYVGFQGDNGQYIYLKAPPSPTLHTMTLPSTIGTAGQVLQTDGTGISSWVTPTAAGANTTLSNLGTTAISANLLPDATANNRWLGGPSNIFQYAWATNVNTSYVTDTSGGGVFGLDLVNRKIIAPNGTTALDFATNGQIKIAGTVSGASRYLLFYDTSNTNFVGFRAPTSVTTSTAWILPNGDGTSDQVLKTDGAGNLGWSSVVASSLLGANNGVATLDAGGKVPVSQLPSAVMTFEGTWDASTNTPTLADGTGNAGMVYQATVAGSQDLGSGSQTFAVGDWVTYNASGIWQKSINSNAVVSVNSQTGVVSLTTDDVPEGTTNLYFSNARAVSALSGSLSGKANIALDNLSSVAINTSLLPASNNSISLGSSTLAFDEAHVVSSYIHASTTDFVVEKAVASTALAASSTTLISGLSFAHATYKSAIIHYQFSEATTNARRVGTLYVTTDGTTTSISDTNADTATVALDFSAAINGANLEISAVSTSSNICTFRAKQSLFLS